MTHAHANNSCQRPRRTSASQCPQIRSVSYGMLSPCFLMQRRVPLNGVQPPGIQDVASKSKRVTLEKWATLHERTANRRLCHDTSAQLKHSKCALGRRCTPPEHMPPTPEETGPSDNSFGVVEPSSAQKCVEIGTTVEEAGKLPPSVANKSGVDQKVQSGNVDNLEHVEEPEVTPRSRSRYSPLHL